MAILVAASIFLVKILDVEGLGRLIYGFFYARISARRWRNDSDYEAFLFSIRHEEIQHEEIQHV